MEKRIRVTVFVVAGVILLSVIVGYGYIFTYSFLAMRGILIDQTVTAPGFSFEAFDRVQVGWSEQQVVAALGQPLRKQKSLHNTISWVYTWKGPMGGHARLIIFDHHIVSGKFSSWIKG